MMKFMFIAVSEYPYEWDIWNDIDLLAKDKE